MSDMFPAVWDGECAECGADFESGDLVGYQDGLLVCDGCWNEAEEASQAAPAVDPAVAAFLALDPSATVETLPGPPVEPEAEQAAILSGETYDPVKAWQEANLRDAAPYNHLPLNQDQWKEQAAAIGDQVEANIQADAAKHALEQQRAAAATRVNMVKPPAPPVVNVQPGQTVPAFTSDSPVVEYQLGGTPDPSDYYVCPRGHVTAQRPCEQCRDVVLAEQQQWLDALSSVKDPEDAAGDAPVHDYGVAPAAAPLEQAIDFHSLEALVETEHALDGVMPYEGLAADQVEDHLKHKIRGVITDAISNHPRSLQTRIGPSEIGTDCDHCLAAKLAGWEQHEKTIPWLPTVGTAVHSWIEEAFHKAQAGFSRKRWLMEQKVLVGYINGVPITGSTDLVDIVAGMTVDWKLVGASTLKEAKMGPSEVYRIQQQLYAKGWRDMGVRIDWVAIAYLPRNAISLNQAVWWFEEVKPADAEAALERASAMARNVEAMRALGGTLMDDYISNLPRKRDKRGQITCFDCKRFKDYPTPDADPALGGLIDMGELDQ